MAFNGSYAASLSPTATETLSSSHLLSASISSLSSSISSARPSSNHVSKSYRQASTLFLTRRLPEALSTVLPLIAPRPSEDPDGAVEPAPVARSSRTTRVKVWSLYLTILNAIVELDPEEGKEAFGSQEWRAICSKVRDGEIWEEVVRNGYHGVEADVDSEVVINLATILLAHARTQQLNQKRLENYLAAVNSPNLDLSGRLSPSSGPKTPRQNRYRSPARATSGADTPRDLNARVKILELYTLHVLLRNNEWDYAREFISMSSVLDEERRDAFLQALQSLQEEQEESAQREKEEKQRREDQLRRDLEEARRLRAQNEERERRRLEEERARREGSEVDYGIESTPSTRSRHTRAQSGSAVSRSGPPPSNKGQAVAPMTFSARATMILTNLRALVEHWSAALNTNPLVLMRTLAFVVGLLLMFSRKSIRERIARVLGVSWSKVKATAGMGVKVSYI